MYYQERSVLLSFDITAHYTKILSQCGEQSKEVITMTEGITLTEYERAEAELRTRKRHVNFYYHATIFVVVNVLLIVVNMAFFAAYPWFLFPLVLWGIGLLAHYFEAFVWVKSDNESWEAEVEVEASKIHSRMAA